MKKESTGEGLPPASQFHVLARETLGARVTSRARTTRILLLTWLFEDAARGKHFGKRNYLRSCIIGSQPKNERENIKKMTHSVQPSHPETASPQPCGSIFLCKQWYLKCFPCKSMMDLLVQRALTPITSTPTISLAPEKQKTRASYLGQLKMPLHLSRREIFLVISSRSSPWEFRSCSGSTSAI